MSINWSNLGREVVAKRVGAVAAVTALVHVAVALHWLTVVQSADAIKAVTGAVDGLGTVAGVLYARRGVSPLVRVASVAAAVVEAVPAVADDPALVAEVNAALDAVIQG